MTPPDIPDQTFNLAPDVEGRIHQALELDREQDTHRRGRLGMSQIGKCERALWAELHGEVDADPPMGRTLVIFEMGNAVEDHVVKLLQAADFSVTKQQERMVDFNGMLVGHTDGRLGISDEYGNRTEVLLEIKSANAKKFGELKDLGYCDWNRVYAAQLQIYMKYTGLTEAVVVVSNKNTQELYVERIFYNETAAELLVEKAQRIIEAETVPPRPDEGKSRYCQFCKWCGYGEWCFSPMRSADFDD